MESNPTAAPGPAAGVPACYRHPGRETYIACQRCSRPICTDCMSSAAVGFQCPDCVREGHRSTRQARTTYGGTRSSNPAATSMLLIAVNVLVWLTVVFNPAEVKSNVLDVLMLLPQGTTFLMADGSTEAVQGIAPGASAPGGAVWQLLTSMFAHEQVLHIGFNMLALYVLGPQVEALLGRGRFLAVYFLAGLTGSVLVFVAAAPSSQTLGASGAIFGLMGALVAIALKQRADLSQIGLWIGLNFLLTFTLPSVSWQGHLGGFLGGLAVASMLVFAPRERRTLWQVLGLAAWAVALVVVASARYVALA